MEQSDLEPKTVALIADLLKSGGGAVVEMLKTLFGPALSQYGLWWGDKVQRARQRDADLAERLRKKVDYTGATIRAVPETTLFPLIEAQELEEDEFMRDAWANLLYSAATGTEDTVRRSFVSILKELGPVEVKILNAIVEADRQSSGLPSSASNRQNPSFIANSLAKAGLVKIVRGTSPRPDKPEGVLIEDDEILEIILSILCRNELLIRTQSPRGLELWEQMSLDPLSHIGYGTKPVDIKLETLLLVTPLARAFVRACSTPKPKSNADPDQPKES